MMAFSEMIDELFEDLPLLACERESEYDDVLSLALVIPDINDWGDVLGVKRAVDHLWQAARYQSLRDAAAVTDKLAGDVTTLARELDLPVGRVEPLVHLLHAGGAPGVMDWKQGFRDQAGAATPEMSDVGCGNADVSLQSALIRALERCEVERAAVLAEIEERNPKLAETLRAFCDAYLAWRASSRMSGGAGLGSFEDVWGAGDGES